MRYFAGFGSARIRRASRETFCTFGCYIASSRLFPLLPEKASGVKLCPVDITNYVK
jgi:hypothetical protein